MMPVSFGRHSLELMGWRLYAVGLLIWLDDFARQPWETRLATLRAWCESEQQQQILEDETRFLAMSVAFAGSIAARFPALSPEPLLTYAYVVQRAFADVPDPPDVGLLGAASQRAMLTYHAYVAALDADGPARADEPDSAPALVPLANLIDELRTLHPRARTQIALLEFMSDRKTATFEDIAWKVHGDAHASEGAIRQNVFKLNESLEEMRCTLRLVPGSGCVIRNDKAE
jgi:hypothetical protein